MRMNYMKRCGVSKEVLNSISMLEGSRRGSPTPMGASAYNKSLSYSYGSALSQSKNVKLAPGCEDYLKRIEAAANFSKDYSAAHSPKEDILQGKLFSVIFKVSESQLKQTITYHFWKKTYANPLHYIVMVSTQDRQVEAIELVDAGSIPTKFFKITDKNYVAIVEYATPRL